MLKLRKSTTQALDQPKPAYRVTGIDPKGGDIDEQFALIESEFAYGSPASDPTHRKIRVGDSLPEGEVTGITPDGIQVIPDYGDEYVIPLGGRPGYKPPTKPVQAKPPLFDPNAALFAFDHFRDTALAQGLGETFDRDDVEPGSFEDFKAEETDKYRVYTAPEEIDREPALWSDMETATFVPYDPEIHGDPEQEPVSEAELAEEREKRTNMKLEDSILGDFAKSIGKG